MKIKFSECVKYMIKGPFGSDMKKSLYVPKSDNTYKVYVQGNAIQQDEQLGEYYVSEDYFHKKLERFEVHPGDYLITCDGTLGKYIKLSNNIERGVISSSLLLLKLNEDIIYDKYFELIWEHSVLKYLASQARNACLVHLPSAKVIGNVEIDLPDLETQKLMADKAYLIKGICKFRNKQLGLYDDLIKSRFVEMFGDIYTNDKNWAVKSLKELCLFNPKKTELNVSDDYVVSFVPMAAVSEKGDIDTSEIRTYSEVKTGFTYFREMDVLFAKITPCMENGKGAIAKGLTNGIGFGTTEFHVLRPDTKYINSRWLYTVTTFDSFRKDAERKMSGSAGQKRVPIKFFEDFKIGIPPIELQWKFDDFVNHIDKLKFKVQQSLDETQLLFDSLMQKYFG